MQREQMVSCSVPKLNLKLSRHIEGENSTETDTKPRNRTNHIVILVASTPYRTLQNRLTDIAFSVSCV